MLWIKSWKFPSISWFTLWIHDKFSSANLYQVQYVSFSYLPQMDVKRTRVLITAHCVALIVQRGSTSWQGNQINGKHGKRTGTDLLVTQETKWPPCKFLTHCFMSLLFSWMRQAYTFNVTKSYLWLKFPLTNSEWGFPLLYWCQFLEAKYKFSFCVGNSGKFLRFLIQCGIFDILERGIFDRNWNQKNLIAFNSVNVFPNCTSFVSWTHNLCGNN